LLADQQVAIDGLRRRIEILRGELSEPGRRGTGTPSDVRQQLDSLEARLMALEQARALALPAEGTPPPQADLPAPPPGVRPPNVAVAPTPTRIPGPQEAAVAKELAALQGVRVDGEYREALELVRQGQCNQAIPRLRDFIRKNAKSEFADNAQYLIGSCYYMQRDYNRAIIELNEVLLKYPRAEKVPPALLMLADAFADSGDKIDARLILQKLISDHPRSEEAEKGRQKLQALGE